jgi:RNA polymerase sigma-70 factor, ECF subfamily
MGLTFTPLRTPIGAGAGFLQGSTLPTDKNTDKDLIARCQKSDMTAFNTIVSRHKSKIYNYVYRMTGNIEDAEDITQEVFMRMYTGLSSFRAEASLSTWLFRIAGNLVIDKHRRSKNEKGLVSSLDASYSNGDSESENETRDVPDYSQMPEKVLGQKELGAQIENALLKLPEKLRSAVILYDIENLSYEEIAQMEKVPLGTIKSRIFNARVALRQHLKAYLES